MEATEGAGRSGEASALGWADEVISRLPDDVALLRVCESLKPRQAIRKESKVGRGPIQALCKVGVKLGKCTNSCGGQWRERKSRGLELRWHVPLRSRRMERAGQSGRSPSLDPFPVREALGSCH